MKIITQIENNYNILTSEENMSLYENKEYLENEIPYYFKTAYLPLDLDLEYCKSKYLEITDEEKILPIIEEDNIDEYYNNDYYNELFNNK